MILLRALLFVFSIAAAFLFAARADQSPSVLTAHITLPSVHGEIGHLAADLAHGRLFVAAAGNDTVEVIDIKTNSLAGSLKQVAEPRAVAYLASLNRLYVLNAADGSLRFFDADSLKPLGALHLGLDPAAVYLDAAANRLYAAYGNGAIAVLDENAKLVVQIALPAHPEGFDLDTAAHRLYVNLPDLHSAAVVDTAANRLLGQWLLPDAAAQNVALAVDAEHRRLFIACRPARLFVLDADTGSVVARLPTVGGAGDVFYDPIHARVYVIGGQGRMAVYAQNSANDYTPLDPIPTVAGARTGLFVPEWNRLFVAVRDFAAHSAEIRVYQPR